MELMQFLGRDYSTAFNRSLEGGYLEVRRVGRRRVYYRLSPQGYALVGSITERVEALMDPDLSDSEAIEAIELIVSRSRMRLDLRPFEVEEDFL